jgi:hypothetical protein
MNGKKLGTDMAWGKAVAWSGCGSLDSCDGPGLQIGALL